MKVLGIARIGLLTAGICAAGSLLAQDYPHAFPREGVKKLFDNDRITIWEVNWIKNVPQPFHRHRYDMAGVFCGTGTYRSLRSTERLRQVFISNRRSRTSSFVAERTRKKGRAARTIRRSWQLWWI